MFDDLREKLGRAVAKAVVTRSRPLALDRPIVTFTFDDIPVSAAKAGADILEANGVRGSFYVCGGLAGRSWDIYDLAGPDLVADLVRRGHEVGCHTAAHGRLGQVSRADLLADIERNAALLAPLVGPRGLRTFAYPFGLVRIDAKLAIQRRFRACRGIHDGINVGRLDLGRLRAAPLEDARCDATEIDALLDAAVRQRGWLVFYSHDVSETPSPFGVTPRLLAHAVAGAARRGCAILTTDAALDAAGVP